MELVPVISYFAQKGKCKHCAEKIHWQYPLVEIATALVFVAIVHFLAPPYWSNINSLSDETVSVVVLSMLFFASTLIAITITDFREKLIPHEITYPAIILGLIFSGFVRHDFLGTMAGVGASYIIFDFIDHFGVQFYYWTHPGFKERDEIDPDAGVDDEIDYTMEVGHLRADEENEPFMVMGGGDSVLSALIAAWLGWQKLIPALIIGFLVGAVMGGVYLLAEMRKEKMMQGAMKRMTLWAGIAALIMTLVMAVIAAAFPDSNLWGQPPAYLLILAMGFGGGTLGVVTSPGPRVVKHFPFGPALAIGALFAIFLIASSDQTFIRP